MRPAQLQPFKRRLRGFDEPPSRAWRRRGRDPAFPAWARKVLGVWWGGCLGVIGAAALQLWPEAPAKVAAVLDGPAMALAAPFPNCAAAHAAGYYDIPRSSPAYRPSQDGDDDGYACEPAPGDPWP